MPVLLIYLIGAGGTGFILFIGWLWRWRRVISAAASTLVVGIIVATVVALVIWAGENAQTELASPMPAAPTLTVVTWGESDARSDVTSAATPSPSHIVFAQLEIVAGDSALSIPALGTSSPENLVWLGVRDTGRPALTDQARRTTDGTLWLPSHSAELVHDFAGEPLLFPDAGCSNVAPGARCAVTLVWEIAEHGQVPITSLALLPGDEDPSTSTPTATIAWPPGVSSQSVCDGPIRSWCTDTH
ncbi:hypothetical protein CYJ73_25005 [Gordonia terrae]|uniref:Uncharacterized protein n=1 Tax=Gordonia terrae TaxID=2055 RepID=A0A2I1R115_9ACTN|nr:hypothetical protein [Gordonia terrae]PKZ62836.1 hypothetical protein CYJ73_25005 [Gordonia terrae]